MAHVNREGRAGVAAPCPRGGVIGTATISFGQQMPKADARRASEATLARDLFLAPGSSPVVYPAAGCRATTKENGARLAITDNDPAQLDSIAGLVVRDDIGGVLWPFIEPDF